MKKTIPAILLIIIFHSSVWAQEKWVVQKTKDGITISNRHSATSSFNDIRVEVDLPGSLEQLAAILTDVSQYTNWSYATKKAVIIKQTNPGKFIYYSEIEVPWPATNRFFYAEFDLKINTSARTMSVVSLNLPDYKPEPKDLVKVPFSKGVWNVTTSSPKLIHVDYTLELNPGGSLPAWMLNLFSSKGPLETFENIKKKMTALNPSK